VKKYALLEKPKEVAALGSWSELAENFGEVVGYTYFGDFFLRDPETSQIAVLYTMDPELMPTSFTSIEAFVGEMLADPEIEEEWSGSTT